MHYQMPVRVSRGLAHLLEEPQPRRHVEPSLAAIFINRRARDVFHHEVGHSVFGRAAVEQPRDVGVIERGQNLPLGAKTAQHLVAFRSAFEELDGDLFFILPVGALGQIDRAHAAAPQLTQDAMGADPSTDHCTLFFAAFICPSEGRRAEETTHPLTCGEERFGFRSQRRVFAVKRRQISREASAIEITGGFHRLHHLLPTFRRHFGIILRRHSGSFPLISR